jgi:hypothetical protein
MMKTNLNVIAIAILVTVTFGLSGCGGGGSTAAPAAPAPTVKPATLGTVKDVKTPTSNFLWLSTSDPTVMVGINSNLEVQADSLTGSVDTIDVACWENFSLCPPSIVKAPHPTLTNFKYVASYSVGGVRYVYGLNTSTNSIVWLSSTDLTTWTAVTPVSGLVLPVGTVKSLNVSLISGNYVMSIEVDNAGSSTIYFATGGSPTAFTMSAGSSFTATDGAHTPFMFYAGGYYYLMYSTLAGTSPVTVTAIARSTNLATWTQSPKFPAQVPFAPFMAPNYDEDGYNRNVSAVEVGGKVYFTYVHGYTPTPATYAGMATYNGTLAQYSALFF